MKIDAPLSFPKSLEPERAGSAGAAQGSNQADRVGLSKDEVRFSVDAEKVQQLKADLAGLPEMRQDRVEALKQAVNSGTYKVSNEKIAEAMFQDLLGSTRIGR
ncbi:MAG TPA: flagellar biosynthesis anti-sigma factor FlgM [Terriglobia bacterium]|jgi:negative regulator of flagellin synthesis FlgM|nr:flagellar biosynthesis anti-sigma factor FlgM [Terriglobia bacterium]